MAKERGRLKIFFGYAAGVGKTYAMLQAALAAREKGIDVVIGSVSPHTMPETAALADTLEQLGGDGRRAVGEFDLDAAILRSPQLILVDELARANPEGCRHARRYQDVEELLKAGIDVYTTVNAQNIESLSDIAATIMKHSIKDRIPDDVFDRADQVELIDIEPQELMERLKCGTIDEKQGKILRRRPIFPLRILRLCGRLPCAGARIGLTVPGTGGERTGGRTCLQRNTF
mgnify:CR=1 FL=1